MLNYLWTRKTPNRPAECEVMMMIQSTNRLLLMCSFQLFTQVLLFFFSVAVEALGFGEMRGNCRSAALLFHLRGLIKWILRKGLWSVCCSDGRFTFSRTVQISMKKSRCKAVSLLIYFLIHLRALQTVKELKHTACLALLLGGYTPTLFAVD